jgi:hypothetical protein
VTGRSFHLGDLVSVYTGILVSPDRMGGVHNVVDFVTGGIHFTHQLKRACEVVAPELLRQHPWLDDVDVPDDFASEAEVTAWLAVVATQYGERHTVTALPSGAYVGRDPLAELREMMPNAKIIEVEIP